MTATGSHGNFDSLRGAPPFTQGSRGAPTPVLLSMVLAMARLCRAVGDNEAVFVEGAFVNLADLYLRLGDGNVYVGSVNLDFHPRDVDPDPDYAGVFYPEVFVFLPPEHTGSILFGIFGDIVERAFKR